MRNQLDQLKYVQGTNWDSHLDKFNGLVAKIATFSVNLTGEDKIALITRSLPESLAQLCITLSFVGLGYTPFLAAIRAEVYKRQYKPVPEAPTPIVPPLAQAKNAQGRVA